MLTEQRFIRSEQTVWEIGLLALIQSLGYADALRFINQILPGQGDYLSQQDQIFGQAPAADLYDQAEAYWAAKQKKAGEK